MPIGGVAAVHMGRRRHRRMMSSTRRQLHSKAHLRKWAKTIQRRKRKTGKSQFPGGKARKENQSWRYQ